MDDKQTILLEEILKEIKKLTPKEEEIKTSLRTSRPVLNNLRMLHFECKMFFLKRYFGIQKVINWILDYIFASNIRFISVLLVCLVFISAAISLLSVV